MQGKHGLGQIDAEMDNSHGLPLFGRVDEKFSLPMVALRCRLPQVAAGSGRGSPFHSLDARIHGRC